MGFIQFNLVTTQRVGTVIITISQMRKLGL